MTALALAALVSALADIREFVAVEQEGELSGEFFALVLRGDQLHGEAAAVFHDADDFAFDAADMVEVGDDALAQSQFDGRFDGCATDRDVVELAGIFLAVLAHEAAEQGHCDALVTAAIGNDPRQRLRFARKFPTGCGGLQRRHRHEGVTLELIGALQPVFERIQLVAGRAAAFARSCRWVV